MQAPTHLLNGKKVACLDRAELLMTCWSEAGVAGAQAGRLVVQTGHTRSLHCQRTEM